MEFSIEKKRPVGILTFDNYEQWFDLFGEWTMGEGIDFVLRKTVYEYAYVDRFNGFGTGSTPSSSSSPEKRTLEVAELLEKLKITEKQPLQGHWDVTRLEKWVKAEAKVRYIIKICLDDIDVRSLKDHDTLKIGYEALWDKYSKIRPATAREDSIKLTNYQWEESQTVDNAWVEIKNLRRRVVNANPRLDKAYDENAMLQFLLPALPKEDYAVTVLTLDAQPTLSVQDKLTILKNREDVLRTEKATEEALAAKQSAVPQIDSIKCKFCGRKPHTTDKCAFQESFTEIMEAIARKEVRRAYKGNKRYKNKKPFLTKKSDSTESKGKKKSSVKHSKSHDRANVADVDSLNDYTDDYTTTDSDSDITEGESVEHAHLTRDEIRKVPYSSWCSDSCASSHMTDDKSLFRTPLVSIRPRAILVGGGQLFANERGTAQLKVKGSGSVLISDVLYVPKLGVNLLSTKRLCSKGLTFTGDENHMAFWRNQDKVLEASGQGGVYVLSWIKPNLQDKAFSAVETGDPVKQLTIDPCNDHQSSPDYFSQCLHTDMALHNKENSDATDTDANNELIRQDIERYQLWHNRCVHAGPEVIRNLHHKTTLKSKVKVPSTRDACITCKLAKLRKRISKEQSPWKETILALVYADIAGPFHTSLRGNQYVAKLVDSASRLVWVIFGKDRKDIVQNLRSWKKSVEKQSGLNLMAVRIDNATELRALLKEWVTTDGIQEETTVPHSSFQNGPAEKSIQTTENDFRAMLKAQGLPLEFWDEATATGAYVRNRIMNGPTAGDRIFTPYEAFYGEIPVIDHFPTFGCQAVCYVDPKSLPAHDKRNPKQVDRGRLGVFMGYMNETTKQWRLYAPDLGRTITVSTIDFLESKKGGDLNLRIRGSHPQGTSSDPVDRKSIGRPKETLTKVEIPPKEKLNNFEIRIPAKPIDITDNSQSHRNGNHDVTKPRECDKPQITPQKSTISNKRPASLSEEEFDTRALKKIKAFLVKARKIKAISELDALEMGFAAMILRDGD